MIVPLLISGKDILENKELIFNVASPFQVGTELYSTQGALIQDVKSAVESSHSAFTEWKNSTYHERRELLLNVANKLEKKIDYFKKILIEMGLPEWFSNFNIQTSLEILRESAAIVSQPLGCIPQENKENISMVINEPLGPILSIAPWNAPMILCIRAIAGPVAAGCSVILKTSEQSPLVHYELAKLFRECGALDGLVNTINHRPTDAASITEALISSQIIKKITFTGSSDVGRIIATTASKYLKPVLLELGGKSPVIVTGNADLKEAAENIVLGGFAHNGQICMSTERVYVVESIYDQFLNEVISAADKISKQQALPQRSVAYAKKIESLLNDAIYHGATILFGKISRRDAFLSPTILANVPENNPLYDQETFGPTFFIQKVGDNDEATLKVNSSRYGLSSSIWTKDILEGITIARKIECGAVHINGKTVHDEPVLPHGGVKESGFGRFNGLWGLSEFQYNKTITISKQ